MHAYLIMAHTNEKQLGQLISVLDYIENDIYIHLDIKMGDVNIDALRKKVKYSRLFFVNRKNVIWGHYSQIECELTLFKAALEYNKYEYLHLLSGMDLPLCSQENIHRYFNQTPKREYVHIEGNELKEKDEEKCYYRFFLQKYVGNKEKGILYYLQRLSICIQKKMGIKKNNKPFKKMYKGANWVSVTGEFIEYLVSKEDIINKVFRYSKCCDEIFLQTILMNSPFANRLSNQTFHDDYSSCQRYIDWHRGNPYVFKEADYDELISSGYMFARKFDSRIDSKIVDKIVSYVKGGQNE